MFNRWSGWSRWRSGKTNLPFHLCPKRRASSPISAYPSVKCVEMTSYGMDLPRGQAGYGHTAAQKRLRGSWELCFSGWGSGVGALVGSGGSHLALHYSNVTLIACKPWAFRPPRGWLQTSLFCCIIHCSRDRPEGWAASWALSPAPEHPLLGLLIHTKNQAFLLSAWFNYCHCLLFKSLETENCML